MRGRSSSRRRTCSHAAATLEHGAQRPGRDRAKRSPEFAVSQRRLWLLAAGGFVVAAVASLFWAHFTITAMWFVLAWLCSFSRSAEPQEPTIGACENEREQMVKPTNSRSA